MAHIIPKSIDGMQALADAQRAMAKDLLLEHMLYSGRHNIAEDIGKVVDSVICAALLEMAIIQVKSANLSSK